MTIRSVLTSLLLILALAGLVANGAQAAPPMPDGAGMARHMSMPDCDGCPGDAGDAGEALACSAACALVVAGDLGPAPLGLLVDAPARPLPAVAPAAPPHGVTIPPDPPRPRRALL